MPGYILLKCPDLVKNCKHITWKNKLSQNGNCIDFQSMLPLNCPWIEKEIVQEMFGHKTGSFKSKSLSVFRKYKK